MSLILGIETSCDETAAAVVEDGRRVRSNIIASQHDLHERYGGVVPEIASRAHLEHILPVIDEALRVANVTLPRLDAVAVGNRPGLIGSLLVGVSAAKALAWSLDKPLIGIDHVQAHLYAATMADAEQRSTAVGPTADQQPPNGDPYPALGLVVSGGHTSLYAVRNPLCLTRIGRTIDDAVGEAYDKAAVILGLPYPGGPNLDRLASRPDADPSRFNLPRSLLDKRSLDFSFSGLKTALLYQVRGTPLGRGDTATFARSQADLIDADRRDLAAAFQQAAVETLILKLERALDRLAEQGTPARAVLIGGGVSANSLLRARVVELGRRRGLIVGIPPMSLCLDNAAMIAGLGHHYLQAGMTSGLDLPAIATTA